MTSWMRHLLGSVCLTVTAAAPEQVLNRLVREGVFFWDLQRPDPFTCRFSVRRRDRQRAEELAERSFGTVMEATTARLAIMSGAEFIVANMMSEKTGLLATLNATTVPTPPAPIIRTLHISFLLFYLQGTD